MLIPELISAYYDDNSLKTLYSYSVSVETSRSRNICPYSITPDSFNCQNCLCFLFSVSILKPFVKQILLPDKVIVALIHGNLFSSRPSENKRILLFWRAPHAFSTRGTWKPTVTRILLTLIHALAQQQNPNNIWHYPLFANDFPFLFYNFIDFSSKFL